MTFIANFQFSITWRLEEEEQAAAKLLPE